MKLRKQTVKKTISFLSGTFLLGSSILPSFAQNEEPQWNGQIKKSPQSGKESRLTKNNYI